MGPLGGPARRTGGTAENEVGEGVGGALFGGAYVVGGAVAAAVGTPEPVDFTGEGLLDVAALVGVELGEQRHHATRLLPRRPSPGLDLAFVTGLLIGVALLLVGPLPALLGEQVGGALRGVAGEFGVDHRRRDPLCRVGERVGVFLGDLTPGQRRPRLGHVLEGGGRLGRPLGLLRGALGTGPSYRLRRDTAVIAGIELGHTGQPTGGHHRLTPVVLGDLVLQLHPGRAGRLESCQFDQHRCVHGSQCSEHMFAHQPEIAGKVLQSQSMSTGALASSDHRARCVSVLPSTVITWPLTRRAASLHSQTAVAAMSSADTNLRIDTVSS